MKDEMKEDWETCPNCHKSYFATKIKFPSKDVGHSIPCPSCGAVVGWVSKGTDDFNLQSEEVLAKQQQEESLRPICPMCGRKMVKRTGYSEFWGCSNYPNCKGIREIDENYNSSKEDDEGYY